MSSSSSVWVQLYYKGREEPEGNPVKIRPIPEDGADLKDLLKTEKAKKALEHCDALHLNVYSPGTTPPFSQDKAIDPGDDVPTDTTSKKPLIVVAPAPDPIPQQPQQSTQLEQNLTTLVESVRNMGIALHEMKESMPSVVVGHVVIPSVVSQDRQKASLVMSTLNMTLLPFELPGTFDLPNNLKNDTSWNFHWKWMGDDPLENTSYKPVCDFLSGIDLIAEDVSGGQNCINGLLYNSEIYTPRQNNPFANKGQKVYLCHRVQGRTDIAVLKQDRNKGAIMRNLVSFAIEIKTVKHGENHKMDACWKLSFSLLGSMHSMRQALPRWC